MRTSDQFIEIGSKGKTYIINKAAIIFVCKAEFGDEKAMIMTGDGDRMNRIIANETYDEVANALLLDPKRTEREELYFQTAKALKECLEEPKESEQDG